MDQSTHEDASLAASASYATPSSPPREATADVETASSSQRELSNGDSGLFRFMERRSVVSPYEADDRHEADEDEEDEEEDDDNVRRSWSTEKDPPASSNVFSSSSDLADWRGPASTRESIEDLEESVRQALEILNTSINSSRRQVRSHRVYHSSSEEEIEEEDEEHDQDWRLGYTADGKPYYYDNGAHDDVQDTNRFTVAELDADASHDEYDSAPEDADEHQEHLEVEEDEDHQADDEHEADDGHGHEDNESEQVKAESVQPEVVDSEWQTAYTAKGRVYYYNRRTRESSWTKPAHFVDRGQNQEMPEAASSSFNPYMSSSVFNSQSVEKQSFLFCCFCGDRHDPEALRLHLGQCHVLQTHKQQATSLYGQFQQFLVLLSEDSTLRSLQYASSFPDATPSDVSTASISSIQDNLTLLHRRRAGEPRTSFQQPIRRQSDSRAPANQVSTLNQPLPSQQQQSGAKDSSWTRYNSSRQNTGLNVQLTATETCRYCQRSFAQGRLAKHEAVCPRVFGSEGSWGRGVGGSSSKPSHNSSVPPRTPTTQLRKSTKAIPVEKRNLKLSYEEYQATLVDCPCCKRKFAPSGAQQHIDICKSVQNRPKNPISLMKDYALAG